MKYRESIVTSPSFSAVQTDAVLEAVTRADLRRRRRRALQEGLAATIVALGVLCTVAVLRLAVPVPPAVWWMAAVAAFAAPTVALLRAVRRQPDLLAAAAALDHAAGLHDTLTTAEWFAESPTEPSPWIAAQRDRAVAAAATLDVDRLCPTDPPRLLKHAAAGLALLLVAALLVPASWSRGVIGLDAGGATRLADDGSGAFEDTAADETDATPMSTEELLAAAEQGLRSGTDTPSFEAGGTETSAGGSGSSDAGDRGAAGEVPDVAGSGPPPAGAERGEMDESTGGERAAGESLQDALDRAADEARQAAEAAEAEAQTDGSQAGDDESGDDSGSGAGGGQGGAGMPAEGDAAGDMPSGHLSGPGGGEAADGLTLEAARADLEITLKREQLASRFTALASSDEALIERQSESGTSELPFQNITPATGYQGTGAETVRPVPWAYQELVRKYFLERARQERKDPR
jgi:hypothetical protein